MQAVGKELGLQIGVAQRVVGAALEVALPRFHHAAVLERDAQVAGELFRVGVGRVDHVAHLGGQCPQVGALHHCFGVFAQAGVVLQQAGGNGVRNAELGGISIGRRLLERQRLPQAVNNAFGGFALDLRDVGRYQPLAQQLAGAVNVRVGHGAAGVGLESNRGPDPLAAHALEHGFKVAARGIGKAMKQAVLALKHCGRALEAGLRQAYRAVARLRCPAGVHAFGPGAVGQVFDDARGHAAGDAEGVHQFVFAQAQGRAQAGHSAHHAKDGGRVKAGFVHFGGRHGAQAAHDFRAHGDATQQVGARQLVALGRCQQSRHDDHAGMHRPAFVGVVKVFAVRGNAVDKCGGFHAAGLRKADHAAGAVLLDRSQCGQHIVFMAGGDADAGHVHQQALADGLRGRPAFGAGGNDGLRQAARDGLAWGGGGAHWAALRPLDSLRLLFRVLAAAGGCPILKTLCGMV